jgi:hypothetical protein
VVVARTTRQKLVSSPCRSTYCRPALGPLSLLLVYLLSLASVSPRRSHLHAHTHSLSLAHTHSHTHTHLPQDVASVLASWDLKKTCSYSDLYDTGDMIEQTHTYKQKHTYTYTHTHTHTTLSTTVWVCVCCVYCVYSASGSSSCVLTFCL